jgi:hypothetical protein
MPAPDGTPFRRIFTGSIFTGIWGAGTPSPAALAAALDIRATARRWGGNSTSTYHWKFDVWNLDNDWYYEVLPDTSVMPRSCRTGRPSICSRTRRG